MEGYKAQVDALGQGATALVTVANAVAEGRVNVVPEVLVTGGGGGVDGLAATLMRYLNSGNGSSGGAAATTRSPVTTAPALEVLPAPPDDFISIKPADG